MQETLADIRRDIEETRARVTQTLAELDGEVAGRKDAVREHVTGTRDTVSGAAATIQGTITGFAREHPWYALGAALGLGLLVARSGADAAVVHGAVDGTKAAARGIAGAASSAATGVADKAKGLIGGGASGDTGEPDVAPAGLLDRLQAGLAEAVSESALVAEMRREAAKIGSI